MHALNKPLAPRYENAQPSRASHDSIARYLEHMTSGGRLTSNFAAMCEVLSSSAVRSTDCPRCEGLGAGKPENEWQVLQWEQQLHEIESRASHDDEMRRKIEKLRGKIHDARHCRACDGSGRRQKKSKRERHDSMFTTVRCGGCKGCGEVLPWATGEDVEDVCQRCRGDACVVPVTAKPIHSFKGESLAEGATADQDASGDWTPPEPKIDARAEESVEANQEEFAETAAVVEAAIEAQDIHPDAIAAYYGPEGDKWAPHSWGRAFSLAPWTSGGKALSKLYLKRPELKGAGHLTRPIDRIVAEREEESRADRPDDWRSRQISKMDTEVRLLERALLKAIADAEEKLL